MKCLLETKTNFKEDTFIYYFDSGKNENDIIKKVKLDDIIKLLNDSIGNINNERWDKINGDKTVICNKNSINENNPNKNFLDLGHVNLYLEIGLMN